MIRHSLPDAAACHALIQHNIAAHGWHATAIAGTPDDPLSWVYTTGLSERGERDLVVFGLQPSAGHQLLSHLIQVRVARAQPFTDGESLTLPFKPLRITIRDVDSGTCVRPGGFFGFAVVRGEHNGIPPEFQMAVLPDQAGHFPWEQGINPASGGPLQPAIWNAQAEQSRTLDRPRTPPKPARCIRPGRQATTVRGGDPMKQPIQPTHPADLDDSPETAQHRAGRYLTTAQRATGDFIAAANTQHIPTRTLASLLTALLLTILAAVTGYAAQAMIAVLGGWDTLWSSATSQADRILFVQMLTFLTVIMWFIALGSSAALSRRNTREFMALTILNAIIIGNWPPRMVMNLILEPGPWQTLALLSVPAAITVSGVAACWQLARLITAPQRSSATADRP